MKPILFIDRDGTLIREPQDEQIDSFEKLEFIPGVFTWLGKVARELDFELVMVTNQDGLGTASFPEENFWPVQNFIIKTLANEGIIFSEIYIDKSFEKDKLSTRKPRTGMLSGYLDKNLSGCFVIGDRQTDIQLAENLGCGSFLLNEETRWKEIYEQLSLRQRVVKFERNTNETKIKIEMNPDGKGNASIDTGIIFFNHMLEQFSKHSRIDMDIKVSGDLHIDEHHTIEDTAIALGEALALALHNKAGIERYGFVLPMDDCLSQVALDFGGRPWLVWNAEFKRERIGDMPTEMFFHFFKSFSDAAKCNINIEALGENEHHKIESIFKALAKSIKMAIKREPGNTGLPTTKGKL